jgi:hypothetical protein
MTISKALSYALVLVCSVSAAAPTWATCDASRPSRTPTSRYVINGETVYDKNSNLTWQRCSQGQHWSVAVGCVGLVEKISWDDAQNWANGWRLPTKDELLTLVATECKNPSVNEAVFPGMDLTQLWYWTSTDYSASFAWAVDFGDGGTSGYAGHLHAYTLSVRLVRGG